MKINIPVEVNVESHVDVAQSILEAVEIELNDKFSHLTEEARDEQGNKLLYEALTLADKWSCDKKIFTIQINTDTQTVMAVPNYDRL